jgi:cell wall-associated NlpC family hydrolase
MPLAPIALLKRLAPACLLAAGCAAHAQGVAHAATTPPPGTMTGAYGQSLQQQQATTDKTAPQPAGAAKQLPAQDAVSRFLSERGLLNAGAEPGSSSRLLASVRDTASELVLSAMNFLGVRYKLGGNSVENGFDCSGFVGKVFSDALGFGMPRTAAEMSQMGEQVKINELKPGDLVFFNTMRRAFSHVGIYQFVHAPSSGGVVRVEDMRISYWAARYDGARRVLPGAGVRPTQTN